jgi:PAS domain S-box-containing protein
MMAENMYSSLINYTRLINEVLDTIAEGFFVLNFDGEIQKTNKTFQKFIGLDDEKIIGVHFEKVLNSLPSEVLEMLKNALICKKKQEDEFFWQEKSQWFRFTIYPFEEGLTGIFSDITEKKLQEENIIRSENFLKAILNSTSDTNILVDKQGYILSFNRAAAESVRIFYQKELQLGQNMIEEYNLPSTKESFTEDFATALSGNILETERLLTFPTGEQVWVNVRMFPVFNEAGEVWAVSLNYTNIDRLKRQHAKLQEIARLQSHTIRRPLTSILGLIDILDKNALNEENQKIIEYLKQSALELDMVIHEIVKNTEV